MNIALWLVAGLLAASFLYSGAYKIIGPKAAVIDRGFKWAEDFSPLGVKLIGGCEVLGAVGLIAPPLLGIFWAVPPLAALGLSLLMIGGIIVHIRRGEQRKLAAPIALGVLAATVAVLRSGPYCF